jgi:peptidoglycan/LPS O-acetylase OafA/YrhL
MLTHGMLMIIMIETSILTKSENTNMIQGVATAFGQGKSHGLQSTIHDGKTALISNVFSTPRLYFLDNLRILLAVLVVMHHVGQPYGPGGSWLIPADPSSFIGTIVLGSFMAINMSFFIGLFFMISAYFVPGSYEHKGAGTFYKDRLVRLGVPIVVFMALVLPVMLYLLHGVGVTSFGDYYHHTYLTIKGLLEGQGLSLWHLWFLEQLLIFSGFYVLWRKATGGRKQESPRKMAFPSNFAIAVFAVALGLAMFAVRIIFPLNLWLPFISFEPAHYPEYIALFAVGILAFRNGWLNAIPAATARKWGCITVLAIVSIIPMLAIFPVSTITAGGLTLASLALSLWEAVVCVGMCISLIYLFRTGFNVEGKFTKALADNTFTVYLIHVPVIVSLQYLLEGVNIHPLLKFAIVCLVGVPTCFLLSHYVVRRLPYAKYVL